MRLILLRYYSCWLEMLGYSRTFFFVMIYETFMYVAVGSWLKYVVSHIE